MPVRTELAMGTLVTMRAFAWFREIEGVCTRFDAASEGTFRCRGAGEANPVRAGAVRAAGGRHERRSVRPHCRAADGGAGFNQEYRQRRGYAALATAAFVLGPEEGIELLEREGVEGLIVTPKLEEFRTGAFQHAA